MSKILMWTDAAAGHVTPAAPIAAKLIDRGHEIVWITGRQYQGAVEATGATFHPFPEALDPNGMEYYFHGGRWSDRGQDGGGCACGMVWCRHQPSEAAAFT
jgi:hypothetical protein